MLDNVDLRQSAAQLSDDVGVQKTPLIAPVFRKKLEELWVCRVIKREERGLINDQWEQSNAEREGRENYLRYNQFVREKHTRRIRRRTEILHDHVINPASCTECDTTSGAITLERQPNNLCRGVSYEHKTRRYTVQGCLAGIGPLKTKWLPTSEGADIVGSCSNLDNRGGGGRGKGRKTSLEACLVDGIACLHQ